MRDETTGNIELKPLKMGLVINPWAGIGGTVALKGSDGEAIRQKALSLGAIPQAQQRTETALRPLSQEMLEETHAVQFYTVEGAMGGDLLLSLGLEHQSVYQPAKALTTSQDTIEAVKILQQYQIDLLVFAGGDGTARDVYDALQLPIPVMGIPAGTKIHSAVYCITPQAAAELLKKIVAGEAVELVKADVMDIDEDLFRQGKVRAKFYGELLIPDEPDYIQAVKMGSVENEQGQLLDIAADVVEHMATDHLYIMGSGSTVAAIMDELSLKNTLLGIDVVLNQQCIAADVTSTRLMALLKTHGDLPRTLYVTVIGGQGHVFGRGNQQLTPEILQYIGRYNIQIIATKNKIKALQGRSLISDCGNATVDHWLSGRWSVLVGYHETLLYPLGQDGDRGLARASD